VVACFARGRHYAHLLGPLALGVEVVAEDVAQAVEAPVGLRAEVELHVQRAARGAALGPLLALPDERDAGLVGGRLPLARELAQLVVGLQARLGQVRRDHPELALAARRARLGDELDRRLVGRAVVGERVEDVRVGRRRRRALGRGLGLEDERAHGRRERVAAAQLGTRLARRLARAGGAAPECSS
jgi:hypothetical protein